MGRDSETQLLVGENEKLFDLRFQDLFVQRYTLSIPRDRVSETQHQVVEFFFMM